MIEAISAVTLGTHEMPRAVRFYRALGFEALHSDEQSSFTSFRAGMRDLIVAQPTERRASWWGRVIFYVADVDALYERALAAGCPPTPLTAIAPSFLTYVLSFIGETAAVLNCWRVVDKGTTRIAC